MSHIPTLRQFMLQQQVRSLYRRALRELRVVEDVQKRRELAQYARTSLEQMRHVKEEHVIKSLIAQGHAEIDTTVIHLTRAWA